MGKTLFVFSCRGWFLEWVLDKASFPLRHSFGYIWHFLIWYFLSVALVRPTHSLHQILIILFYTIYPFSLLVMFFLFPYFSSKCFVSFILWRVFPSLLVSLVVAVFLCASSLISYPGFLFLVGFLGQQEWQSLLFGKFSFAVVVVVVFHYHSNRLAEIKWYVCIWKSQIGLFVSFSKTDSRLWICHLFVWSNLNF